MMMFRRPRIVMLVAGLVVLALAFAFRSSKAADFMMMGYGSAANTGGSLAACGTGVINLSTGCTQPMLGGL